MVETSIFSHKEIITPLENRIQGMLGKYRNVLEYSYSTDTNPDNEEDPPSTGWRWNWS